MGDHASLEQRTAFEQGRVPIERSGWNFEGIEALTVERQAKTAQGIVAASSDFRDDPADRGFGAQVVAENLAEAVTNWIR